RDRFCIERFGPILTALGIREFPILRKIGDSSLRRSLLQSNRRPAESATDLQPSRGIAVSMGFSRRTLARVRENLPALPCSPASESGCLMRTSLTHPRRFVRVLISGLLVGFAICVPSPGL